MLIGPTHDGSPLSHFEFLDGPAELSCSHLNVVLYTVEDGPLLNDQVAQVSEQVGQLGNGRRDLGDFLCPRLQVQVDSDL